jgi:hypothetical protein
MVIYKAFQWMGGSFSVPKPPASTTSSSAQNGVLMCGPGTFSNLCGGGAPTQVTSGIMMFSPYAPEVWGPDEVQSSTWSIDWEETANTWWPGYQIGTCIYNGCSEATWIWAVIGAIPEGTILKEGRAAERIAEEGVQVAAAVEKAAASGGAEIVASNGTRIVGFTRHGVDRAIGDAASQAGTKPQAILDALRNPTKIVEGIDKQGRPFQVFTGRDARVVVNPETGRIVSVNPLSRRGVQP